MARCDAARVPVSGRPFAILAPVHAGGPDAAATANRTTEDTVLERITDSEVKEALEALPDNFRIPVLLADVEGFSYKEIADIMDVPIGTVMSRLHRGRRALQKALYDFGLERGLVAEETTVVNK